MPLTWDTSCPDWEKRIVNRQSLIPPPIFPEEADAALEVFKSLHIVDVAGKPTFGEACDPWVFDFVRYIFGSYDSEDARRLVTEFFLLISKKNMKSTMAAGIMITALLRNWRYSAELLIIAPTIEIAKNAFEPARDMVREDPELSTLLHIQENIRQITHRVTKAALKVIAADSETVGGKKASFVLVDELWLFGKRANADAMLREATGGQVARPEGFTIYLSTQSEEQPAGVFKAKLDHFRNIRDGKVRDPKRFALIYEFPEAMLEDESYLEPKNWYITNPNMGRSVDLEWLEDKLKEATREGKQALTTHLSKHLNVEVGRRVRSDGWDGAEFWLGAIEQRANEETGELEPCTELNDLHVLLARSEVVVVGIDGGGLDDLLGLAVLGRERDTGDWLLWAHAWAHPIVLQRRQDIEVKLREFEKLGQLTFVSTPGEDIEELAAIVSTIEEMGLFPEKAAVGVDTHGINDIVDGLNVKPDDVPIEDFRLPFGPDRIIGIPQGWKLNAAIKTAGRRVASRIQGKRIVHGGMEMMLWCVENAKATPVGSAISITKQHSGSAKIDPLMAMFDAVSLMSLNPQPRRSVYEDENYMV